ncbi:MAG TPA: YhdP family protein [Gammaproteobacteria bacterium]
MANWKRRLWKWLAGTFAVLVILLATVTGLFRLLTPLVPGYRLQVEQWASSVLQRPVEIHSMGAEWGWHGPEVTLEGVRILSRDRKQVVTAAEEVRLGLNLRSLVHGRLPRPDRVVLVAPRVEVERATDGSYQVRGLEGSTRNQQVDWRRILDEIFAQSADVAVKNGQVTLFDARHPMPALFQHINLKVDSSPEDHRLQGDLALPADFGHKLEFELRIRGPGIEPAGWDWEAQLTASKLQLPRWLSYLPAHHDLFTSGSMDLDLSAAAKQGVMQRFMAELDAHDLVPAPGRSAAGKLKLLQGRIEWQRKDAGWCLEGRHLELQDDVGAAWPRGNLDLEYTQGADGERWAGDADFLRLQDIVALADWLEAPSGSQADEYHRRLHAFAPSGEVTALSFKLHKDGTKFPEWSVKAGFQDLGLHAAEGWPGFAGMDGKLDLSDRGGDAYLAARDADVDFRPLFRTPLHAGSADLIAKVIHDPSGWRVAADTFHVENLDGAAHGRAAMGFPADGSAPTLDIDATVERGDARNKSTYFPVGIMPKPVVQWLDDSIKAGKVTSGTVAIHGKTSDFPYRDGKGGTFDIQFHLEHGELDYQPGWPAVKDFDADVRFLDQGLTAKVTRGSYNGLSITGGTAQFKELASGVLEVDGAARGDASQGLDFLRTGPLKDTLEGYLDGLSAKGDIDASVHIYLPLTELEHYRLQGKVGLHQASAGLTNTPALTAEHLEGTVDFGNYGFSMQGVHGTLLGGPLTMDIRRPRGKGLSPLSAHGTAVAPALAALMGYASERWLEGQADWQLDGRLPLQSGLGAGKLSLTLRSDLRGLTVKLPAPFSKAPDAAAPLRVLMKFDNPDDLAFSGNYGGIMGLRLDYAPSHGALAFDRGDLHLGAGNPAKPAAAGLKVTGYLPSFDWDEWKPWLPEPEKGREDAAPSLQGQVVPALLLGTDLKVGRIKAFGQMLDEVRLVMSRGDEGWQGRVESAAVAGVFRVPMQVDKAHPIQLDMDRVSLAKLPTAKDAARPASPEPSYDPRKLPALRFTSKRFQYGDLVLDSASLALVPLPNGTALQDFKAAAPSFTVAGDGSWIVMPSGQQHTTLNADVESSDVEQTLRGLGYDAGIAADYGSLVAALNWQDSPFGDVTRTLAGSIHAKLVDGQLKEVQPGAGRVFGLLSLNALPRRLLLNFSDVFAKGFGFDSVEGDFMLQDGDAYTQNLVMKGPAASIHLVGRTGLAKHDFDEALIVDASVGSSLPVVGALAGGVGVGAVVFLLTEIFKKPLAKAGQVRYHLTGTWDNPDLTKVPDTAPAASTRKP